MAEEERRRGLEEDERGDRGLRGSCVRDRAREMGNRGCTSGSEGDGGAEGGRGGDGIGQGMFGPVGLGLGGARQGHDANGPAWLLGCKAAGLLLSHTHIL